MTNIITVIYVKTINFSVIERRRETGIVSVFRILLYVTYALLSQCRQSRNHRKVIHRHLWQEAIDEVEHISKHTDVNRTLYRKRQETTERVFADTKEKHGMR